MTKKKSLGPSYLLASALIVVLAIRVSGQRWGTQVCPKVEKYLKQEFCPVVGVPNECLFRCASNTKCCPTPDTCGVRCTRTVAKTGCPIPVDIALLLDSSGSIGKNWEKVLDASKNLVDAYDVSEAGTHFGLISYSTNTSLDISFTKFTGVNRNAVNLKRVIDTLPLQGGKTFIDKALKLANEELFDESKGMRKQYKKICIVLTDGQQTTEDGDFTPPAEVSFLLKDKGVEVYTLAIGADIDIQEALDISTGDGYVYTAENFDSLNENMKAIIEQQCKGCDKSLDLVLGIPNSISLGQDLYNVKEMMSKFVSLFKVNNRNAHIGIVSYDEKASLELPLNRVYSTPALQRFIRNMIPNQAHGFNTAAAMRVAADHAFSIFGGVRQTQPKVMVLLVPRASTSTTDEIRAAATKLKGMGVRLMVVGIQNTADRATYSSLVTQPHRNFLLNKNDYNDLAVALYEMADTVCKAEYGKCPPPGLPSAEVNPDDLYQCTYDQDCTGGGLCCLSGDAGTECRKGIKNCFMPFELTIAVDNSDTLLAPDLPYVKKFIKNLIRPYANSENDAHFGLMTYASTTRRITDGFRKFRNEKDLEKMIEELTTTRDPERKVNIALEGASRDFFSMEGGTRHGHPRFLVFLTTSGTSPETLNLKSASKDLDLLNVQRIAIGIKSDSDLTFLQELASDNLAFAVQSSDQLPTLLDRIQPLLCKEKKGTCPPANIPDPAVCRRSLDPRLIPCGRSANKPRQNQRQNDWDCPGEDKCCTDETGCFSVCTYPKIVCGKNRDIAIILENTDLIGGERAFGLVKSFAAELAGAFQISKGSTHVAIATYRSRPRTVLRFTDNAAKDRDQVLKRIRNIQFGGGSVGSTTAALETAVNLFKSGYGARDNVNQTLVLIGSFDVRQMEKAAALANILRSNLVDIFAVSIGERANYPALRSIVSLETAKNVFTATSADAMKAQLRHLVKTICDGALKEYIAWASGSCRWQFTFPSLLLIMDEEETI